MPDYKAMYLKMAAKCADAIELYAALEHICVTAKQNLIKVQQECEELCISEDVPPQ